MEVPEYSKEEVDALFNEAPGGDPMRLNENVELALEKRELEEAIIFLLRFSRSYFLQQLEWYRAEHIKGKMGELLALLERYL